MAEVAMVKIAATTRLTDGDLPSKDIQGAGRRKAGVTRRRELATHVRNSRLTTTCSRRSTQPSSTAALDMAPASTAVGQVHPMALGSKPIVPRRRQVFSA